MFPFSSLHFISLSVIPSSSVLSPSSYLLDVCDVCGKCVKSRPVVSKRLVRWTNGVLRFPGVSREGRRGFTGWRRVVYSGEEGREGVEFTEGENRDLWRKKRRAPPFSFLPSLVSPLSPLSPFSPSPSHTHTSYRHSTDLNSSSSLFFSLLQQLSLEDLTSPSTAFVNTRVSIAHSTARALYETGGPMRFLQSISLSFRPSSCHP